MRQKSKVKKMIEVSLEGENINIAHGMMKRRKFKNEEKWNRSG